MQVKKSFSETFRAFLCFQQPFEKQFVKEITVVMTWEVLKQMNPRSVWETTIHTLGTMLGYRKVWLANVMMLM